MSQYKAVILKMLKENNLLLNESTIRKINPNIKYDELKPFKELITKITKNLDIEFKLIVPDTRNENQIWKDIYKKHFKNLPLEHLNSKINALIKRGYLSFKYNLLDVNSKLFDKITYIFNPQRRKNAKTFYDNTIIMYGNNDIPVFKDKWVLSPEEWTLYPTVYINFVLTDLNDEETFRKLFDRAKYKLEVKTYLESLPDDSMVDIDLKNAGYEFHIEIKNSDIPNKDLSDLFSFFEELDYEDLRGLPVLLNNKAFHV